MRLARRWMQRAALILNYSAVDSRRDLVVTGDSRDTPLAEWAHEFDKEAIWG